MASVTSLGAHQPTALQYFVQERLLNAEPSPDSYTWQTLSSDDNGQEGGNDDELISTKNCVVWCRGGIVRKSFRFEVEEEPVTNAILTQFPTDQRLTASKQDATWALKKKKTGAESSSDPNSTPTTSKALVVFLKTQAHVYFLSGTSHVIHLPFEVEHVSAAPNGLIIQRKLRERQFVPESLNFPRVPPNSFVSSQTQPWSANSSVLSTFSTASLGSPQQLPLPATALLGDLLQTPSVKNDSIWPRLFTLTDPLAEMGLVVAKIKSTDHKRTSTRSLSLDPAEELIHITKANDLAPLEIGTSERLVLAVTLNRATSMYTVWRVKYAEQVDNIHHAIGFTSGLFSRRRSSFAPGPGTGATTPVVGGQYAFRESLGAPGLGKSIGRPEEDFEVEKLDFASSLDPDFEPGGLPRRKSRRVSSMLARADLSTSHERSAFSELARNQPQPAKRRGESMGSQHTRTSFSQPQVNGHGSFHGSLLGNSINSFLEAPVDTLLEELKAGGDFEGFHSMGLDDAEFEGLRKELIFKKIQSLPIEQSNVRFSTQNKSAGSQFKVFTLVAPPCAFEDPRRSQIVICILDSSEKQLTVLTLDTKRNLRASEPRSGPRRRMPTGDRDCITICWNDVRRAKRIIDACKLVDGNVSRILVLTESSDGHGQLTLQDPWSLLVEVHLPTKLLMSNIRIATHNETPQKKRESGPIRVLSQKPRALQELRHSMPGGLVDILDDEGRLHQIRIRMEPQVFKIKQAINVCRSVLPGARNGETILVAWWNVMQWLNNQEIHDIEPEWTSFVVVLFSLVIGAQEDALSMPDRPTDRRSRSFLRSSSGAQSDDKDWKAMLAYESRTGCPTPSWRTSNAWDWLSDHETFQGENLEPQTNGPSGLLVDRNVDVQSSFIQRHIDITRSFLSSTQGQSAMGTSGYLPTALSKALQSRQIAITDILTGLHLLCEEQKLSITSVDELTIGTATLKPILAQIFKWLGWEQWAQVYDDDDAAFDLIQFDSGKLNPCIYYDSILTVYSKIS